MQQAVRVQANFTEYVPFAVLLLVLAEITGLAVGPQCTAPESCCSRAACCTPWGLSQSPGRTFGRFYGTAGTWLVIVALSLWLVVRDYSSFSISGTRLKRSPTRP